MSPHADTALPTEALRRAHDYAAIFLNVGDKWRGYVPVDGTVRDDTVTVQGVLMERATSGDGWRLTEGDESWVIRAVAKPGE